MTWSFRRYLHTNCLAALANMSSQFRNLHPYVAQVRKIHITCFMKEIFTRGSSRFLKRLRENMVVWSRDLPAQLMTRKRRASQRCQRLSRTLQF